MKVKLKQWLRRFIAFLSRYDRPEDSEIVFALTVYTAQLALRKDQYVEFAPLKGVWGTFKLTGNSLPCFTYTVFEKKIMEFIQVRVEVSKPARIHFLSKIVSTQKDVNGLEVSVLGKEVPTLDKYKEPFHTLAMHLFQYFPFPMEGGRKQQEEQEKEGA